MLRHGKGRDNQSVVDAVTIRLVLPEDIEIVVSLWKLVGRVVQDSEDDFSSHRPTSSERLLGVPPCNGALEWGFSVPPQQPRHYHKICQHHLRKPILIDRAKHSREGSRHLYHREHDGTGVESPEMRSDTEAQLAGMEVHEPEDSTSQRQIENPQGYRTAVHRNEKDDRHRNRREDSPPGIDSPTVQPLSRILQDDPEEDDLLDGRVEHKRYEWNDQPDEDRFVRCRRRHPNGFPTGHRTDADPQYVTDDHRDKPDEEVTEPRERPRNPVVRQGFPVEIARSDDQR